MTARVKQEALMAMRSNPVLARNVVLLAMRHAIADAEGGTSKAEAVSYSETYYSLALREFAGPQACDGSTLSREKLAKLFPAWKFEYWVTSAQKKENDALRKCATEVELDLNSLVPPPPAFGAGVAVSLAEFYVIVPSPPALAGGLFEQSDSLRLALAYRDRLSQAIIDRNIASTVKDLSGNEADPGSVAASTAFELLNEGWDWQNRSKSK